MSPHLAPVPEVRDALSFYRGGEKVLVGHKGDQAVWYTAKYADGKARMGLITSAARLEPKSCAEAIADALDLDPELVE